MKQLTVLLIFLLMVVLTSCDIEFGQNYEHLQQQDPKALHRVNPNLSRENIYVYDSPENPTDIYNDLNDNLCELHPLCCGKFTEEQKDYRDLERRAVVENRSDLCQGLPSAPLIISCPKQNDTLLYSKQRCLDSFE